MPTTPLPSIGLPVISGSSGSLLFVNGVGNLDQSSMVQFDTAGVEVGIGVQGSSITARFHVRGSSAASNVIRLENENQVAGMALDCYSSNAAHGASFFGRHMSGSVASPLRTDSGFVLMIAGGTGARATDTASAATLLGAFKGYWEVVAADPYTSTGQATYQRWFTTSTGATAPVERLRILAPGHLIQPELTVDPSTVDLTADAAVAVYNKNDKLVFAYNNAGEMTYVSIPLDGATTTWTHSTAAP